MYEKLEFDISVKSNELSKALNEASNKASSLSSYFAGGLKPSIDASIEATKNINKEMSSFSATTLGVAAGQFAFSILQNAISFVTSSIKESIGAFAEQEDALNKLKQSFILTGGASESAVQDVEAFATELESISKFSDDAIIRQVAFAKSLGTTTAVAKEMVLAAANMSATFGGSLEENTEKLGRTISGTTGRMSLLIPELKSLTIEQLKAGDAAKIINEKFAGSAQNDLKTYTGSMAALSNSFNNLQESVGEAIVQSKVFGNIYAFIKKSIDDVNTSLAAQSTAQDINNKKQTDGSITAEQLANNYKKIDKEIANLNEALKEQQDHSFLRDILLDDNMAGLIMVQIKDLTKAREDLSKIKISAPENIEVSNAQLLTVEQEEAIRVANAKILALDNELINERKNIRDQELNNILTEAEGKNEEEIARILAFDIRKAEIDASLKTDSLNKKLTHEEAMVEATRIAKEKELAILQANGKATIALGEDQNAKDKARKTQAAAFELQTLNTRAQYISAFGNLGAALAADGSKTQFLIQKASAIAGSIVATQLGVAQALALGPILGPPLAANMQIIGNINTAAIAATAIKGFEQGGIVGSLGGASTGPDNRVAQIRDGEMVLNANDQKTLFDAIKSGSFGGGNIQLIIDGREIAYAVRSQVQGGFRLA